MDMLAFTPAERPPWRSSSASDTSSMITTLQQSIHTYSDQEKATMKMHSEDLAIAEFVFSVAAIEGEGLETLHQTQEFLSGFKLSSEKIDDEGFHSLDARWKTALSREEINPFDIVKSRSTCNMYKATLKCLQRSHSSIQPVLDTFFIKHLHEVLYSNTEEWHEAGNYRKCSAFTVTSSGDKFSYLSFRKIPTELNRLVKSTNALLDEIFKSSDGSTVMKLLKLGGAFFMQFEIIHPFHDGNGRIGRLLLAYLLSSLTPFGLNSLYVESERFPVFVDRCMYLQCFEGDSQDPSDITALIIEGIYVSWKNCLEPGHGSSLLALMKKQLRLHEKRKKVNR